MKIRPNLRLGYVLLGVIIGVMWAAGVGDAIAQVVGNAVDIVYDNTTSGLTASDVQAAIDEIEGRLDTVEGSPFSISKYVQTGVSFANNTQVTVTHNLNTTSPLVSITITTAGDNFPRTNYRVLNANSIEVWQSGSGTTFTGDVIVIAP